MDKEFSAGAIIYRKEDGRPYFLVIFSRRNMIWGFPKGHLEPGESEHDAAVREIEEETGITDLIFVDGFRVESVYDKKSGRAPFAGTIIEKHSTYFLCETKTKNVVVDEREISDYMWAPFEGAVKLLQFESMKTMLEKARAAIPDR